MTTAYRLFQALVANGWSVHTSYGDKREISVIDDTERYRFTFNGDVSGDHFSLYDTATRNTSKGHVETLSIVDGNLVKDGKSLCPLGRKKRS